MKKIVLSALLMLSAGALQGDQDCCSTVNDSVEQNQEQAASPEYKLFESIYAADIKQINYWINEKGADVNCSINNMSPLPFALLQTISYENFYDIIKTLLDAGASTDFTFTTEDGHCTIDAYLQEMLAQADKQSAECTKRLVKESTDHEEECDLNNYKEALNVIAHNIHNVQELISLYHE